MLVRHEADDIEDTVVEPMDGVTDVSHCAEQRPNADSPPRSCRQKKSRDVQGYNRKTEPEKFKAFRDFDLKFDPPDLRL